MRRGSWWTAAVVVVVAMAVVAVSLGGARLWRSLLALHGQH